MAKGTAEKYATTKGLRYRIVTFNGKIGIPLQRMYKIPVNKVAAGAEVFRVLIGSLISGARLKEFVLEVERKVSDMAKR